MIKELLNIMNKTITSTQNIFVKSYICKTINDYNHLLKYYFNKGYTFNGIDQLNRRYSQDNGFGGWRYSKGCINTLVLHVNEEEKDLSFDVYSTINNKDYNFINFNLRKEKLNRILNFTE